MEELQTELINKGHKNAYVNKVMNILKAMLTKAVEWEMVESDILRRVRKVKGLRENKTASLPATRRMSETSFSL